MLDSALRRVSRGERERLDRVEGGRYNRSFPAELVPELRRRFTERRRDLAIDLGHRRLPHAGQPVLRTGT